VVAVCAVCPPNLKVGLFVDQPTYAIPCSCSCFWEGIEGRFVWGGGGLPFRRGAVVGIAERPSPSGCDQGRGGFGSRVGGHKFFVDEATRRGVDRCAGTWARRQFRRQAAVAWNRMQRGAGERFPNRVSGTTGQFWVLCVRPWKKSAYRFTLGERPSGIGQGVGYDLAPCFASWSRGSHFPFLFGWCPRLRALSVRAKGADAVNLLGAVATGIGWRAAGRRTVTSYPSSILERSSRAL
jgi:hypothetical protein